MPRGRPVSPINLSDEEKNQLLSIARSRSLPHGVVQRAQIVLACAEGEPNTSIAQRMGLSNMTVGKWRRRYGELGLEGLHDELRPGRPRTHEDERVAEVINTALQARPPNATQWSVAHHGRTHRHLQIHPCNAGSICSACNRTASATSNSPTTPSSSRKSATSSDCI